MTIFRHIRTLIFVLSFAVLGNPVLAQENADNEAPQGEVPSISAKQLVVMIDGRFPSTGQLTSGAGIVVGRRGGLVYIATAAHVVQSLSETAREIKVQFPDRPGVELEANIVASNFDKGVDLAVLIVSEAMAPPELTSQEILPAARFEAELMLGEGIYFVGQPKGQLWGGNKVPDKLQSAKSTELQVASQSVVPGLSGGAALDEGFRIVGLIVETESGVAKAIPIRLLKELMEGVGYPFDLRDSAAKLPAEEIDPLKELTARGYDLSRSTHALARAFEMKRDEDTALFLALNIPIEGEVLFSFADVPEEFATKALEKEVLQWRGAPLSDLCSLLMENDEHGVPARLATTLVQRFKRVGNRYLPRLACGERYPAFLKYVEDYLSAFVQRKKEVADARSNLGDIKELCVQHFMDNMPIKRIVEGKVPDNSVKGLSFSEKIEVVNSITESFLKRVGGNSIEVDYWYDISGNTYKSSYATLRKGLNSIFSEMNSRFYGRVQGVPVRGDKLQFRSGERSIGDMLSKSLHDAAETLCNKNIRVRELTWEEKVAYELGLQLTGN